MVEINTDSGPHATPPQIRVILRHIDWIRVRRITRVTEWGSHPAFVRQLRPRGGPFHRPRNSPPMFIDSIGSGAQSYS